MVTPEHGDLPITVPPWRQEHRDVMALRCMHSLGERARVRSDSLFPIDVAW